MKIKTKQTRGLTPSNVGEYYQRFLELDRAVKEMDAERKKMSANLKEYAVKHGIEDGNGHLWVETPQGTFKRERRASVFINEDRARSWLRRLKREKEVLKEVTEVVFDVEAFNAILFEAKVTAEQAEQFYDTNENFYLIPQKHGRPADDNLE